MPERAAARNRRLYFIFGTCIILFVGLFLVYAVSAQRTQNRTTKVLKAAIHQTNLKAKHNEEEIFKSCLVTNRARRSSNAQLRVPLKQMLGYFVAIVQKQIADDKKHGVKVPPKREEQEYDFLLKFRKFYSDVKLLPQIDCLGQS